MSYLILHNFFVLYCRRKKKDITENEEEDGLEDDGLEAAKYPCLQCKFKARKQQDLDRHAFEKHKVNRLCTQVRNFMCIFSSE